jgi:hypothetical protein
MMMVLPKMHCKRDALNVSRRRRGGMERQLFPNALFCWLEVGCRVGLIRRDI